MANTRVELKERKVPVSISLTVEDIEYLNSKSNNISEYIRRLIKKDGRVSE